MLKPIEPFIGKFVGFVDDEPKIAIDSGKWFVAQTEPRRERLAKESVIEAGLIVYMPIWHERVRSGRHARMIERPMFPDYLFVYCAPEPAHWHLICLARGIDRILGRFNPLSVPEDSINAVKLFENKAAERAGVIKRVRKTWQFNRGDIVRITQGPFSGFYAELLSAVDQHDRVRALVDMFKRATDIELSAEEIEVTHSQNVRSLASKAK